MNPRMERPKPNTRKSRETNGWSKKPTASRTTHGYPGNYLNGNYATTLLNKGYSFHDPYFGVFSSFPSNPPPPPPYSDLLQKPYGPPFGQPQYHDAPNPYCVNPAEPTSLPLYPGPWSSPRTARPAHPVNANWDVWSPEMAGGYRERPKAPPTRFNNGYLWIPDEDDFASLPPQVMDGRTSRQSPRSDNRRFSDPGLNLPAEEVEKEESLKSSNGDNDDDNDESSAAALAMQGRLVQRLLMEMGALRAANQSLHRELNETKMQLETVKARQNSSWRKLGPEYQPGMFAEMIREVREASRMRDVLPRLQMASSGFHDLNDLRNYLDNQSLNNRAGERPSRRDVTSSQRPQAAPRRRNQHRSSRGSLHGSRADSSIDEDDSSLSGDLLSANAETSSSAEHPNVAGVLAEQVSQLQRDKQQLSEEIKAVRDSRAETEAHVQKLERLVSILRKKITTVNGLGGSAGDVPSMQGSTASSSPTSSLEHVLTGALSQVTIHGPVTNL